MAVGIKKTCHMRREYGLHTISVDFLAAQPRLSTNPPFDARLSNGLSQSSHTGSEALSHGKVAAHILETV